MSTTEKHLVRLRALLPVFCVGWLSIAALVWFTPVSVMGAVFFAAVVSVLQVAFACMMLSLVESNCYYEQLLRAVSEE